MKEKLMIRGFASVTGTRTYFDSLKITNKNSVKNPTLPGWYFSAFGVGTYRLHLNNKDHAKTLEFALTNGINVIDTATNFMDGLSEELIGSVLHKIFVSNQFERENYIIISKAGYIQGTALATISQKKTYDGITRYSDQLWHCLDTNFIKDQLEESLQRLGLKTIDVYLLQNPEYYIFGKQKEEKENFDNEMAEFLLYQEIKKGFIALEESVKNKKIQFYGISTNTLCLPEDVPGRLDIQKTIIMAEEASEEVWGKKENNHFSFIQIPFNIIESQAYYLPIVKSGGSKETIFEFCQKNKITILANRPLNASLGNSIKRLSKPQVSITSDIKIDTQKTFDQFKESENLLLHFLRKNKIDNLPVGAHSLASIFEISPVIKQYMPNLNNLEQFNQFLFGYILQKLNSAKNVYVKSLPGGIYQEGLTIFEKYGKGFSFLAENIKQSIIHEMAKDIEPIEKITHKYFPTNLSNLSFAQKNLLILTSTSPNIIVLNGMREKIYAKETLKILGIDERINELDFIPKLSKDIFEYFNK